MAELSKLRDNKLRVVRWSLAVAALLAVSIAGLTGSFETCTSKTSATVHEAQCGPPTLSDPTVLAVGLLIVFLILPDLSEVGLPGITLKRRIEAAEQKVTDESRRVSDLQSLAAIQQLRIESISLNQTVSGASAQASLVLTPEVLRELQHGIDDKSEAYLRQEYVPETVLPAIGDSDDIAIRSAKLIRLWEEIRRSTVEAGQVFATQSPSGGDESPHLESPARIERFVRVFADELQAVRTVRNAVAHASPVSLEDLDRAIDVAERLLAILRDPFEGKSPGGEP